MTAHVRFQKNCLFDTRIGTSQALLAPSVLSLYACVTFVRCVLNQRSRLRYALGTAQPLFPTGRAEGNNQISRLLQMCTLTPYTNCSHMVGNINF